MRKAIEVLGYTCIIFILGYGLGYVRGLDHSAKTYRQLFEKTFHVEKNGQPKSMVTNGG